MASTGLLFRYSRHDLFTWSTLRPRCLDTIGRIDRQRVRDSSVLIRFHPLRAAVTANRRGTSLAGSPVATEDCRVIAMLPSLII